MRAKMAVTSVTRAWAGAEHLKLGAVASKTFGLNGENEDNTYARFTPSGAIDLVITNPDLLGKFKQGDVFTIEFTAVP